MFDFNKPKVLYNLAISFAEEVCIACKADVRMQCQHKPGCKLVFTVAHNAQGSMVV
jgi:hypothetical protein